MLPVNIFLCWPFCCSVKVIWSVCVCMCMCARVRAHALVEVVMLRHQVWVNLRTIGKFIHWDF